MASLFSSLGRYQPINGHSDANESAPPVWTRLSRPVRPRVAIIALLVLLLFCGAFLMRSTNLVQGLAQSMPALPPFNPHLVFPGTTDSVDWSKFAYTQYVTNEDYLCNSVMIFETLHRLGSKAEKLMLYPNTMSPDSSDDVLTAMLLRKAKSEYGVRLEAVEILHNDEGEHTWADSYTKLLVFNRTEYDRILNVDSDSTILQNMDELFFLPHTPVAMPRAYWGDKHQLSSQIMVIEPSAREFARIMAAFRSVKSGAFDMEIVNDLYHESALVIPHRGYDLLTGEFRSTSHAKYLGSPEEAWHPKEVLAEAKFLHFSDWPVPKPWIAGREEVVLANEPKCEKHFESESDCTARDLWRWFYSDFAERRKNICGLDLKEDIL